MRQHESGTDDEAAVALCAAGRAEGLRILYGNHAAACLSYAWSIIRDGHHAEDAVQEAYLDLWRHADRYDRRRSSVRSWLLMLTHRRAVDRLRSERRRATTPLQAWDDRPDEGSGPDTQAIMSVLGQQARQALCGLTLVQREALVLAYWGGYTQREIAALIGCPVGTVKSRTHAAMTELTATLSGAVDDQPRCPEEP